MVMPSRLHTNLAENLVLGVGLTLSGTAEQPNEIISIQGHL